MKLSKTKSMTEGNELKLLLEFSVPMLIGNIFQQLYNMVDSIIVGKYVGEDALAAVGASGSLNFLFFSLCIGLSGGVGVLISQYFGAVREKEVKKTIANSIYVVGAAGLLMSIISFLLARSILTFMQVPEEILEDAIAYMRVVCVGIVMVALYNGVAAILRALGDSTTPLVFLIISSILNAGMDLIMVKGFQLGVLGAAYATFIAQTISAVSIIIYALIKNPYFRLRKEDLPVDRVIIKQTVTIGIPMAAQSTFIAISCVVLQGVVNSFGKEVMAAYTACNRIEQLVQQPFGSLGTAISTFAGQNIGAKRIDRVRKGFWDCVMMTALFSFCMLIVVQLFGRQIMMIFVDEPVVIAYGMQSLHVTSCCYLGLGMIYITRGMMNGVGDAKFAMAIGFVEVIGRVGFPLLLIFAFHAGVTSIWFTSGLTWSMTGVVGFIRYLQGKWKKMSLIAEKTAENSELKCGSS